MRAIVKEFVVLRWFLARLRVQDYIAVIKMISSDKFLVFSVPSSFVPVRGRLFAADCGCKSPCAGCTFVLDDFLFCFHDVNPVFTVVIRALLKHRDRISVQELLFLNHVDDNICQGATEPVCCLASNLRVAHVVTKVEQQSLLMPLLVANSLKIPDLVHN